MSRVISKALPVAITVLVLTGGCSDKLETGYKPQPLSASAGERRAFYAAPFSPEAKAAAEDRTEQIRGRRPGSY